MSIKAMTWARDVRVGNGVRKFVLLLMADYSDDDGVCWPGIKTVAEKAELDEKTVRRHLNRLAKDGFLTRTRLRRQDGTHGTYLYRLHVGAGEMVGGATCTKSPAGKLPAGRSNGEGATASPNSPEPARALNAPAGKLPAGGKSIPAPPRVPHQRANCPSPAGNLSVTSGQSVRAEPSVTENPLQRTAPAAGDGATGGDVLPVSSLEDFFGDTHRPALLQLRSLPGWTRNAEDTFVARYVDGTIGEILLRGVSKPHRAAVMAEAVHQYLEPNEDGTPIRWSGRRWIGWLGNTAGSIRRRVRAAVTADADTAGPPADDGSRPLPGGGVLLADGRRLTASQAAARASMARMLGTAARGGS